MKPARFSYLSPERLEEVFEFLELYADQAKVIAGGQSLAPMMNMRLARPDYVIDINRLQGLQYVEQKGDRIEIGALTRQYELEQSALLQRLCPMIPYAVSKIGHYAIRQRGTIGGSVVHADPSAELPLMAALLDANVHAASSEGVRTIPAEAFFVTIYTTDLLPNELVTAIDFPVMELNEGWAYKDFTRRVGDYAMVSVGTTVKLDGKGRVERMRMALGGAESIPLNMKATIEPYLNAEPNEEWRQSLVDEITANLMPSSDMHASSEDRIELFKVVIPEAIAEAIRRAKEGESVHE